jgi:hypothetical protein
MAHIHGGHESRIVGFQFHRLKAALALQKRTLCELTAQLPVTHRHAHFVLSGERVGSAYLCEAIRRALGEPAWLFVTGQSHTLRDEGGDHVAG